MRQYVADWISTDEGLASLLTNMAGIGFGWAPGDTVSRAAPRIDVDFLAKLVDDITNLRMRAQLILDQSPAWLTEEQKAALEVFVTQPNAGHAPQP